MKYGYGEGVKDKHLGHSFCEAVSYPLVGLATRLRGGIRPARGALDLLSQLMGRNFSDQLITNVRQTMILALTMLGLSAK